ncbi:DUF4158 domain-containing protein [Streptomyces poriferorum]|uniref:DUF4158 domain-containing protein n=1 Tax=Streptomyces poriferorum TaxID=2798799 RepID=A0ABY9J1J8_9ACTN|nr:MULTISPECIES: DUF4158 domain-containing protein [unclassified Streptomyces]MDP5315718.1 DUF4158 domain-containing protein [Streptomyces sp. Alt4]WLQ61517.1 DUF4158 domain-containing protein [Streptomyces sp. Alt2]
MGRTDGRWGREFRGFLYGRAWTHAEGPVALFNHAVTWLRKNRVLLPGVSVLARQVSEARAAAERRLYEAVARAAHRVDPQLAPTLAELLVVPEGKRVSEVERLRTPPTKSTGTAMVRAMERVEEISAFALGRVNLSRVPVNRLSTLARYGQLSKAQTIERLPEPRRTALLTAVVRQLEAQAVDDALDLFAVLMANRLISPARRASERERLAMGWTWSRSTTRTWTLPRCGRRWRRRCRVRRWPARSRPSRPWCPRTTVRPRRRCARGWPCATTPCAPSCPCWASRTRWGLPPHINFLGRYLFNIKASGPGHDLRPFRDPEAFADDED